MAAIPKTRPALQAPSPISEAALPLRLTRLAEACRQAGAAAATVISSRDKVVVFYKDPQAAGCREEDAFDELHILSREDACILIAVFQEK